MSPQTSDLKHQIERVLNWGPSSHWRLDDFTRFSQRIIAHTGERPDVYDLQTFWQSSAEPSLYLLDTLARFLDYEDWADFCRRNMYGVVEPDDETVMLHAPLWEIPLRWVVVMCWLSVLASVVVALLLVWKR